MIFLTARLIYGSLQSLQKVLVDAEGFHDFNLFQIKVADIPCRMSIPITAWYDVYWIRTFKTVDEAIAFCRSGDCGRQS